MKNVADLYPLTPTQEGILYHSLRDTNPELYFEQVRCDLVGELDAALFQEAWLAVFERHPALRTAFVWRATKAPVQVVRETVELPWQHLTDQSESQLEELAAAKRQQSFDLQRAPISRFTLVTLGDARAHFIWDFHHILLDGWSATMVFDEAIALYNSSRTQETTAAPFRSYMEWLAEQNNIESESRAAKTYWTSLLSDFSGPSEFSVAPPNPGGDFSLGRLERSLGGELTSALTKAAQHQRVTLNTLVQAAWAMVTARYTDNDDVTFGVVSSGRPADLPGVEESVGMFLTTLPMRVRLLPADSDQQAIGDWLRGLQKQQTESTRYQYASLSDIQQWAGLSQQALFDSIVVFENFPQTSTVDADQLMVKNKQVFEQTHFGLTLMVRPEETLGVSALFDRSRFAEAEVDSMICLFFEALGRLAAPDAMKEPLLTSTDKTLLADFNATSAAFSRDSTMHELVDFVVEARPTETALIEHATGRSCTFAELNAKATGLAGRLQHAGIKPGDAVGVAMPRSIDLVVSLLASWKAGAAYVPLDLTIGPDRLAALLNSAGVDVVIADSPAGIPATTVEPTEIGPFEVVDIDPLGAAVISFTSGSSGDRKPVELHHRGIVNRCQWQLKTFPLGEDETCIAKTTLNFVDHLWELWGPLVGGRPVVLLEDSAVSDPRAFVASLEQHRIRRLTMVPSLLDALLDSFHGHRSFLTTITVSGEALPSRLIARVSEALPGVQLLNFYGMSEGTADATFHSVTGPDGDGTPAIGRPIANTSVHVLDRRGHPVPIGVVGEIHVAGTAVASGYRNQPEATAERFVIDGPTGTRRYQSGDLGRIRRDGALEFVGRRDAQVNIKGVRVEPTEVEAELVRHPAIEKAVVSAVGPPLQQALAATVVLLSSEKVPSESGLLDWARQQLPSTLAPTSLTIVDALPTLPTGKVDRRAIAAMAEAALRSTTAETARGQAKPTTRDEIELVELWQQVLNLEQLIGLDDDFFDIGGDSLRAVRLFSRIDRHYGRDLPLAELLTATTPRKMLRLLADDTAATGTDVDVYLLSTDPSSLDHLIRRLGQSVVVRIVSTVEEIGHEGAGEGESPVTVAATASDAAAALTGCQVLAKAGRPVDTLLLIDADLTASQVAGIATADESQWPNKVVFFEPSETEARVPIIDDPTIRARLADREQWPFATETVLVPGSAESLLDEPNVSWLGHLLTEHLGATEGWTHLVPIGGSSGAGSRRLFAVHGEFGNVLGYRDLAVALGDAWQVVGVQASGVHGTQSLHNSIEEMALAYVTEILQMQPTGPYLIGGYSSGGTVAYEMGRLLRAEGHLVEPILWFDHYRIEAETNADSRSRQLIRRAGNRLRTAVTDREALQAGLKRRELQRKVDSLEPDSQWWWSITEIAEDRAEAENLRSMLIGDNMRQARSHYRHDNLEGTIVLYEADQVDVGRDPDRGWRDSEMSLVRVPVPGSHTSLLLAPNVSAIAADITDRFSAIQVVE